MGNTKAGYTNLDINFEKIAQSGTDITTKITELISDESNLHTLALLVAKLQKVAIQNDATSRSTNGALVTSGVNVVVGGTGLNGLTLAAPTAGCRCEVILVSITSGSCVVKTPAGVTFDGTNNTATFDAANDRLVLVYKSATEWQIVLNTSVTLSST